jgi:hypothetical protein
MARRRGLLSPSVLIRRNGLYKGLLGGSRGWLIVGGTFWGARTIRRVFGKNEITVANEVLQPGQKITIEAIKPLTRRERKAGAKS